MMKSRQRRGSSAIEFAVTLPIYLVILSGIADFGWYFKQQMGVTMAARDAARAGSLVPVSEDPVVEAEAHGHDTLAVAGLTGQVACTLEDVAPDQRVECLVTSDFGGIVGLTPLPGELVGFVTMRMEEQR